MKLVGRAGTTVTGCVFVASTATLRGASGWCFARTRRTHALDVYAVFRRARGSAPVRRQGCRFIGARRGASVGMAVSATRAGFQRLIGFDMGGTSTDVCHYAGRLERTQDTEVAGVRLRAPMMEIHTVAAGGGSLLSYEDRTHAGRPSLRRRATRSRVLRARRTTHR